jgi:hypothetical protein
VARVHRVTQLRFSIVSAGKKNTKNYGCRFRGAADENHFIVSAACCCCFFSWRSGNFMRCNSVLLRLLEKIRINEGRMCVFFKKNRDWLEPTHGHYGHSFGNEFCFHKSVTIRGKGWTLFQQGQLVVDWQVVNSAVQW